MIMGIGSDARSRVAWTVLRWLLYLSAGGLCGLVCLSRGCS